MTYQVNFVILFHKEVEMDIEYASRTLEKSLVDQRSITRHYGKTARSLIHRLSDLRVADNLSQITHLPPPRRHKLTGNLEGCWGIDLSKNQRLVVRPVGDYDPNDLSTVTRVRIEDIQDYH